MTRTAVYYCVIALIANAIYGSRVALGDEPLAVADAGDTAQPCAGFAKPLAANERLILIVSSVENSAGQMTRSIDFLAQGNLRVGFTRVGDEIDIGPKKDRHEALREHWLRVIRGRISSEYEALSAPKRRKMDVAIELTIARFLRQLDQAQLAIDQLSPATVARLQQAGAHGIWNDDPLVANVMRRLIQAEK